MRNSPNFSLADEVIVRALEAGAFPSACLLVGRDERVLYRRAYGRLSIEDDAPLTNEHTRYDLASVTKPLVVGMLTLRAMEAGKLCLWDRLGTFLDAPPDKRDITIAQILTHTAGFPTGLHLWELSDQPENSAETILNAPLVSPPGARVRYCCAGFILLGQLLECLYGMGLNELAMRNHTPGMAQGRGLSFYLPAYDNGYTGDLFPRETVGHTGFTGTSFALDPTSGLYVIFLTNRICPSRDSLEIYRVRRLLHNAVYAAASR